MARKIRFECAGAYYHIINRGNYRSWIFETEGARSSFLKCLTEVCAAQGARLAGPRLVFDEQPLGTVFRWELNLVLSAFGLGTLADRRLRSRIWSAGMRWLQSTFANRCHKFRKVNGKLFVRQTD